MKRWPVVFICLFLGACLGEPSNPISSYIEKADLQVETQGQQDNLSAALNDMIHKPAEELKQRRYPDYEGKPDQWTAYMVLQRYYLSDEPLSEDEFYTHINSRYAKRALRSALAKLQEDQ